MLRLKKSVIYVSMILLCCVLLGGVAHASESASSEVQITIETSQISEEMNKMKSVRTGDDQMFMTYSIMLCGAIFILIRNIIKFKKRSLWLLMVLLLFSFMPQTSYAEEMTNVDVTVPTKFSIVFESDGTTNMSEFTVCNHTLLPISIKKIHVVEKNGWMLCTSDCDISVNSKQIELKIEDLSMKAKENLVDIPIGYNTSRNLDFQIRRGAWTSDHVSEEAFQLEFEYEFGTRAFELSFDSNGSDELFEEELVQNGEVVNLPTPFRTGHEFVGWADSTGQVYKNQYTMPIGEQCLKAQWKEVSGFVLYLKGDQSLRFVYPTKAINVGDTYDNHAVTAIYSIAKDSVYTSVNQVPWYDYNMYKNTVIKKVIIEDVIQPKGTAYWFQNMRDCEVFQLDKLDTSKVVDMTYMFGWAGYNATKLELTGVNEFDVRQVKSMKGMFSYMGYNAPTIDMNLQNWQVYNVTDMSYMFASMGYKSKAIMLGFLALWDIQSVTNMDYMFRYTGYSAAWYITLVQWDVSSVKTHVDFNYGVYSKVAAPVW